MQKNIMATFSAGYFYCPNTQRLKKGPKQIINQVVVSKYLVACYIGSKRKPELISVCT
jgi:hypothetical protein